jgi:hypothetical protein
MVADLKSRKCLCEFWIFPFLKLARGPLVSTGVQVKKYDFFLQPIKKLWGSCCSHLDVLRFSADIHLLDDRR